MGFAMLTGIKQEREHFGLTLGLYMWHHDTVIRRNARKVTLAILDNEQKEAFKAVWKNSYRRLYNKYAIKAALIDIEKYYIQNNLNFEDNLRIAIKSKLTSASRRSENIKPVAINHVSSNQAKYSKLFNNLSEKDKLWIN